MLKSKDALVDLAHALRLDLRNIIFIHPIPAIINDEVEVRYYIC